MSRTDASAKHASAGAPVNRARTPASAAIAEFLMQQDAVAPRSRLHRIFGVSPLSEESRRLFWGAAGQLEVGAALEALGDDWTVLHSVPLGREGAPIDHVAIGPGGVFVVNARNHTGQAVWVSGREATVDGHRVPMVRDAEFELGRVETILREASHIDTTAMAVVAIVDHEVLVVRERTPDVAVLPSHQLARWLARRRTVLTPQQVDALVEAATEENTWQTHPATIGDAAERLARFERIRRSVVLARLTRQLWIVGSALVLVASIIVVGTMHFTSLTR